MGAKVPTCTRIWFSLSCFWARAKACCLFSRFRWAKTTSQYRDSVLATRLMMASWKFRSAAWALLRATMSRLSVEARPNPFSRLWV